MPIPHWLSRHPRCNTAISLQGSHTSSEPQLSQPTTLLFLDVKIGALLRQNDTLISRRSPGSLPLYHAVTWSRRLWKTSAFTGWTTTAGSHKHKCLTDRLDTFPLGCRPFKNDVSRTVSIMSSGTFLQELLSTVDFDLSVRRALPMLSREGEVVLSLLGHTSLHVHTDHTLYSHTVYQDLTYRGIQRTAWYTSFMIYGNNKNPTYNKTHNEIQLNNKGLWGRQHWMFLNFHFGKSKIDCNVAPLRARLAFSYNGSWKLSEIIHSLWRCNLIITRRCWSSAKFNMKN